VGNSLVLDKFMRSLQVHFDQTSTTVEDVIIIGGAAIKFTVNGERATDVGSINAYERRAYERCAYEDCL
jgi:hypothetical protein